MFGTTILGGTAGAAAAAAKPVDGEARRAAARGTNTLELAMTELAQLLKSPALGAPMIGDSFSIGGEKFCIKVVPLAKQGGGQGQNSRNFLGIFLEYKEEQRVEARYTLRARHTAFPSGALFEKTERGVFGPSARTFGEEQAIMHTRLVKSWYSDNTVTWLSGQLIITAEVEVYEDAPEAPIDVPARTLGPNLLAMLESGEMSDVTLKCPGLAVGIDAHKLILAARSPVFRGMFGSGMAEAESTVVNLDTLSPAALRSLVHFIYAEELNDGALDDVEGLLAVADQYQMRRLMALCEEKLRESLDVESAAARLVLADKHHAEQLKVTCLDYIKENSAAVMGSEGWQALGTQPNLLQELFAHTTGVRKSPPKKRAAEEPGKAEAAKTPAKRQKEQA